MHLGNIGEALLIPAGLFGSDPGNRQPLNPQVKAQLLAQMPFVSEPVGVDIADLGEATPAGRSRTMMRYGLGAALGAVFGAAACHFLSKKRR